MGRAGSTRHQKWSREEYIHRYLVRYSPHHQQRRTLYFASKTQILRQLLKLQLSSSYIRRKAIRNKTISTKKAAQCKNYAKVDEIWLSRALFARVPHAICRESSTGGKNRSCIDFSRQKSQKNIFFPKESGWCIISYKDSKFYSLSSAAAEKSLSPSSEGGSSSLSLNSSSDWVNL